jgi:hypothetical protein
MQPAVPLFSTVHSKTKYADGQTHCYVLLHSIMQDFKRKHPASFPAYVFNEATLFLRPCSIWPLHQSQQFISFPAVPLSNHYGILSRRAAEACAVRGTCVVTELNPHTTLNTAKTRDHSQLWADKIPA